jgi:HSP20 family protein
MFSRQLAPSSRGSAPAEDVRRNDPFHAMQREMNRVFADFWPDFEMPALREGNGGGFVVPRVDVSETDKEVQVTAELPGLKEEEVSVNFADGMLDISGEHKEETEKKDEKKHYYLKERSYGSFRRTLAVGDDIDEGKIKATFKDGVLTVQLPKSKEAKAKTRKIPVTK